MIISHTIDSNTPGTKLLVLGAVHGNETCGTHGILRVLEEIKEGKHALVSGSVTFVPIVNQKAYDQNVRYTEENLNRIVTKTDSPTSYEQELANELCALIDDCDVLLDLHSFSPEGEPFVFLDYPEKATEDFMQALNLPYSLENWSELYAAEETIDSYDTERYAHENGKIALTVECGSHQAESSKEVAYHCILAALNHCNGVVLYEELQPQETKRIRMKKMILREGAGDRLVKEWQNFEAVEKDQLIGVTESGKEVRSPLAGCIIMPKMTGKPGEEWFYLGEEV